jgi:hypothetical protein
MTDTDVLVLTAVLTGLAALPASLRLKCQGGICPSEYSSNFWWQFSYLRLCHLTCDLAARWFVLFAAADRRLPEQGRNKCPRLDGCLDASVKEAALRMDLIARLTCVLAAEVDLGEHRGSQLAQTWSDLSDFACRIRLTIGCPARVAFAD